MNDFDYIKYLEILCKIIYTKQNQVQIIHSQSLVNYDPALIKSLFSDLVGYDYATYGSDHSSITNFQFSDIENFALTLILEYIDTNEPGSSLTFLTTLKNTSVDNIDWEDPNLQRPIQCATKFGLIDPDANDDRYKITEFGKLILGKLQ